MFHFLFTTLLSKNTLGEKSKPNGSDLKTQWERNQTPMGETHWNIEIKNETLNTNVSSLETIDYQCVVL